MGKGKDRRLLWQGMWWAAGCALVFAGFLGMRQASEQYESAIERLKASEEEQERLIAKLQRLGRDLADRDKQIEEGKQALQAAQEETSRWKDVYLNASAVLPRNALVAADADGKQQGAKPIADVFAPFALAAEVAYSSSHISNCLESARCSVGLLDVFAYGVRNLLLAAYHANSRLDALNQTIRKNCLWRGRQLLGHILRFKQKPMDASDHETMNQFGAIIQDSIGFKGEFLAPLLEGTLTSSMPLQAAPAGFILGLRGLKNNPTRDDLEKKSLKTARVLVGKSKVALPRLGIRVQSVAATESTNREGHGVTALLLAALQAGWRMFELTLGQSSTVALAKEVAEALGSSGVPRSEIFLQGTLLWEDEMANSAMHGEDGNIRRAVKEALSALGVESLDLVVLREGEYTVLAEHWRPAYAVLEGLHAEGHIKFLGLGDVTAEHVPTLLRTAVKSIDPLVLQAKLSIYYPGNSPEGPPSTSGCLLEILNKHELKIQGVEVTSGLPMLLDPQVDAHVMAVARRHRRTPRQILLRWALQVGAQILVGSSEGSTVLKEAAGVLSFHLPAGDVRLLSSIATLYLSGPPAKRPDTSCVEDVYDARSAVLG